MVVAIVCLSNDVGGSLSLVPGWHCRLLLLLLGKLCGLILGFASNVLIEIAYYALQYCDITGVRLANTTTEYLWPALL